MRQRIWGQKIWGKTTVAVMAAAIGLGASAGAACAAERFPILAPDQMTPAQRKVAEAIMAGPRKTMGGPFNAWLRSPATADKLQQVGEQLRFHSSVAPKLEELIEEVDALDASSPSDMLFLHE